MELFRPIVRGPADSVKVRVGTRDSDLASPPGLYVMIRAWLGRILGILVISAV